MKITNLMLPLFVLTLNDVGFGQELKKEYVEPVPQDARSTAVKVKGGTMVFLAGHTASVPQPTADLGNFEAQFKKSVRQDWQHVETGRRFFRRHRLNVGLSHRSSLCSRIQQDGEGTLQKRFSSGNVCRGEPLGSTAVDYRNSTDRGAAIMCALEKLYAWPISLPPECGDS